MSFDNNNSSTSAQHEIKCYYRNKSEELYWNLVEHLDPNPKQIGSQFHHVVPQCLLKKENRKLNVDGVFCTPEQHEMLHHLLASSYKECKSYSFKLSKCLIQWSGVSPSAKARTIGAGPTRGTKGIKQNPDWIEKKRQGLIGKKRSAEQKEKMRLSQLGIPKLGSGMRPYQKSRVWRHPRVSGNVSRKEDWSKAQDVFDLLEKNPEVKHSEAILVLRFNSRRSYCNISNRILDGWVPGLDMEWVNDFVKI